MKKQIWLLVTALTMILAVGCEDKGDNDINPNNPSNDDVQLLYQGWTDMNWKFGGWEQDVTLNYSSNVECEVFIPEEFQEWISITESTKAAAEATPNSAVITIAANNSGEMRNGAVYVVAVDNPSRKLEYTIRQQKRYVIQYTTSNGEAIKKKVPCSMCGVTLGANTYENGVGTLDFVAPVTYIGYEDFQEDDFLESIIIPEGVVEIQGSAFEEAKQLKSVTLPSTLTTIRANAFRGCERLESINLPESITTIESSVFQGCNLTEVVLPSGLTEIANSLFFKCPNLTKITIPDSVTKIGLSAFEGCEKLADIAIPDGVTIIGNSAFENCKSIMDVVIPGGVYTVGADTFKGCYGLRNVTLCEGVASIGKCAFQDCRNVKVIIPSSVIDISNGAFWNCTGEVEINSKIVEKDYETDDGGYIHGWLLCAEFSKIVLGENITKIGNYAFRGRSTIESKSLTEVVINGKVTSIGQGAFYNCIEIKEITIPESVTSIGIQAFHNCGVKTVYCKPQTPPSGDNSMFYFQGGLSKIYVPRASVAAYKSAWNWGILPNKIEGYDF